jgi:hypothetical protein
MAQEEKIIIELDFDTSDFTQSAAKLNKEISDLNKEQRALKKTGEEGSIQYQKNAEALKENKKELNETNKTISNLTIANKANSGSNEQLKAQLSVLTLEYNKLSSAERENGQRGQELNAQINQVTDTLKGNEEAVGDNRRSVGDYGKALDDTPFGDFVGGLKSMGAAFLANPATLVIAAIVGAFALLKKAFERNEDSSNKLGKVTDALAGVFNFLLSVIEPVANFLVDVVIKAFEDLGEVADATIGLVSDALDALGFGDAADSITKWSDATAAAAKDAQALGEAQDELVKSQREVEIIQLTSLKNAEKQRQIRDDESKSIAERIAANEELGNVLQKQSEQELTIANEALRIANERIRLEGASTELLDARKDALVGVAEIEERITGQQSEQLVNVNSLLREQQDKRKEAAAARAAAVQKGIEDSKKEIDLFIAQQGIRAKTLEEQIKIAEQVKDKELEILQRELDAKIISQTEYETQALLIKQDFLALQTEAVIDNGQREVDAILEANQSKIEAGQFLNDELYAQEQQRLDNQLQAQLDFEATRLEQGVISQQEYNDAINAINAENEQAVTDLANEKKAADDEQALVDLENQREIDLLQGQDEFETRQQDLDRQKEQELRSAEETGADTEKIQKKFELASKQIDKAKFNNRLELAGQTADALANLAGRESAAGKALAIVGATINTYQAAAAALAPPPIGAGPVFGPILAGTAIATGLANVRKIASVPSPKKAAKGGIFGGDYHSNGGTKGYFSDGTQIEVEKDELFMVLNRNSTDMINRMSSLNELGGGVAFGNESGSSFADGGIGVGSISSTIDAETASENQITAAIAAQPAPVVVVQDINEVQGETAQVADRAII